MFTLKYDEGSRTQFLAADTVNAHPAGSAQYLRIMEALDKDDFRKHENPHAIVRYTTADGDCQDLFVYNYDALYIMNAQGHTVGTVRGPKYGQPFNPLG